MSLHIPAVSTDVFFLSWSSPLPWGVPREGPDCRFPSEIEILVRIRGGGGNLYFDFYFDPKYSWFHMFLFTASTSDIYSGFGYTRVSGISESLEHPGRGNSSRDET